LIDSVFKSKQFLLFLGLFFSVLISISLFILLKNFFDKASFEIVDNWYTNEIVSLQQGNILSSVTKLQRSIKTSDLLKGVRVLDEKKKNLIQFGEDIALDGEYMICTSPCLVKQKFFENVYNIQLSNLNLFIMTRSPFLINIFIVIAAYFIALILFFGIAIQKYSVLTEKIRNQLKIEDLQERLNLSESIASMARQMAHDIRAPLTAFEIGLSGSEIVSESKMNLLKSANERIKAIADDLLKESRRISNKSIKYISTTEARQDKNENTFYLFPAIQAIVREMNEISCVKAITIEDSAIFTGISIAGNFDLFQRGLCNLLKNSIDATEHLSSPAIRIGLKRYSSNRVAISISDNGKGIPQGVIEKIGEPGFSFGKKNGNGLGYSFAKSIFKKWGGDIKINSKINRGTEVTIILKSVADQIMQEIR
jgi:signal transduction histidine kinase